MLFFLGGGLNEFGFNKKRHFDKKMQDIFNGQELFLVH